MFKATKYNSWLLCIIAGIYSSYRYKKYRLNNFFTIYLTQADVEAFDENVSIS